MATQEEAVRGLVEAIFGTAGNVYDSTKQFSAAIRSKGLLYALIVRLLIFPLIGFGIGYFLYNYKLGIVFAVGFIWYEGIAAVVTFALILAIPIVLVLAGFFIIDWVTS